jgi:acyl carrier protein
MMHPASAGTPRIASYVNAVKADATSGSLRAQLAATPAERRVEVLTTMLAEQAAEVYGIPAGSVDWHTPLPELGLDSLMAVELRARISTTLDAQISALQLNRTGGLSSVASRLSDQLAAAL